MNHYPQSKILQIFVTLQPNPTCVSVGDTQARLVQVLARVMLLRAEGQPEAWRVELLQQDEEISFVLLPLPGEVIAPEAAWQLASLLRQQPEIMDAILLLRNSGTAADYRLGVT